MQEWFGVLCTYLEAAVVCVGAGKKWLLVNLAPMNSLFSTMNIVGFTHP